MLRMYKSMPVKFRILSVVFISALLLLSGVLVVGATTGSGPTLSNLTPGSGTSINTSNTIVSFQAVDPDGIDDSSIQLTVNGNTVSATVKYPELGYWETVTDDSCASDPSSYRVWVSQGFDYTQATVTANIKSSDLNNVSVLIKDKIGNPTTTEWSFNCMQSPVISNLAPANGSLHKAVPVVSAKITDNGIVDPDSIVLKIGSEVCPADFDPATGMLSYTPASAFAEGSHNLYLEVQDTAGNKQTASTNFRISSDSTGPVLDSVTPVSGASVPTTSARITFVATDPQEINQDNLQIMVNGTTVRFSASFPPIGHYETRTAYDSCSGEPLYTYEEWVIDGYDYTKATVTSNSFVTKDVNNVWIKVSDKLGNDTVREWSFNSMQAPVISGQSPANGSTQKFITRVAATVKDNGTIDSSSIVLKLNSNIVQHQFDAGSGIVSYTTPTPLTPGDYNVSLAVKDNTGNPQSTTWSFKVVADTNSPVVSGFTPAEGSTASGTSVQYSFIVQDADGINNSSARILANGSEVSAYYIKVNNAEIGHYVTQSFVDSCSGETYTRQVWVVDGYDPNKATVTVTLNNLPDSNVITYSIADKLGNTTVGSSTFKTPVPPAISAFTPSATWVAEYRPTISAQVSDAGGIDAATIILKIDGNKVEHIYTSTGATSGTIAYTPAVPLTDGTHDVYLEVKDKVGNVSTKSWSFGAGAGVADFTYAKPLAGSDITIANPEISIRVNDVMDIKTVSMTVNGKTVPAVMKYDQKGHWVTQYDSCSDSYYDVWVWENAYYYNRGVVSYKPGVLPDGNNAVTISVTNKSDGVSSYTWSFVAKVPPQVTEVVPANGTTVTTRQPVISAKLTDNSKVASYKMLVDNAEVAAAFDAVTNKLSYTPPSQFPNSTTHTVKLIAFDELGNSATVTSQFHVEIYAEMTGNVDCASCHIGYPEPNHPMQNCDACHATGLTNVGHGGSCGECHGPHPATYLSGACNYCHGPAPHGPVPHSSTTSMDTCGECHSGSLTREHTRRLDPSGSQFTCNTCHTSTDAKVKQAITSGQSNCDACHAAGGHDEVHPSPLDSNCQTCHSEFVTQEHLSNQVTTAGKGYSCGTCHDSTAKEVTRTITANSLSCAGCHDEGHNMLFAEKVPGDIPLHTAFEWTTPIEAAIFAGESATPPNFNAGQVVISSRENDITVSQITEFYKQELVSRGWTLSTEAPYTTTNVGAFVYGQRKLYVNSYISQNNDGSGAQRGRRIELWYK